MKEQFVTYEIALALKELGFDKPCFATYKKNACHSKTPFEYDIDFHTKVEMSSGVIPKNSDYINDWVSAPIYQQVIDWFIEKHDINIEVRKNYPKHQYFYTVGGKTFQHVSGKFFLYRKAREQSILKGIELLKEHINE
jgi:hypothetical protein